MLTELPLIKGKDGILPRFATSSLHWHLDVLWQGRFLPFFFFFLPFSLLVTEV
jgi:hypothetical protein